MKKSTRIIWALILLVIVFFCGKKCFVYCTYRSAVAEIRNDSYEEAIVKLEKANGDKLNRETFLKDNFYGVFEKYGLRKLYKNTNELYAYALAQSEYTCEERDMDTVNIYLGVISADYSGKLCDEIKEFKEHFQSEYDEYLAEESRLRREQLEKEHEQQKKTEPYTVTYTAPYVGMSEYYIGQTVLGSNYEMSSSYERVNKKQEAVHTYYFKKGKSTIFIAKCRKGTVSEVIDYRDSLKTTKNYTSSWSSKKTKDDDRYNAKKYRNAEDFYDDNYYNFWSYEDAEDYYNKHRD